MFTRTTVMCPVCDTTLGYLVKNEVCSFVCRECQWIFSWDRAGKLQKPVKVNGPKKVGCDCGSCQYREEQKQFKRP